MGNIRPAWKYLTEGPALRAKFTRIHDKPLGQPVTTKFNVKIIPTHHYLHYATTFNRREGTEELSKAPIRKYILEKISLKWDGEKGWMDGSGI